MHSRGETRLLAPGEFYGQRVLDMAFATGKLVWTRYGQPYALPQHAHHRTHVCLLVGGVLRESFGRRVHDREKGEMLLCPAWEEHAVEVVESESEYINIEFDAGEAAFEGVPREICQRWPERAQRLIRTLWRELELADSVTPLAVEALAWECLGSFRSPAPRRRRQLPRGVALARDLLEARFRVPPSLADIVAEVGGDPSNLARSFRKWMGCSMGAYVRSRRLEEARRLLKREGCRSISHVAAACGYADQAHMTRAFRREYGVTPGRFRRENS